MRAAIQIFGLFAVLSSAVVGQNIEQISPGKRPAAHITASFDGLGVGFSGPQGNAIGRNPSDNSLAVGPDHIVQIVNSRMAVFAKKGLRFKETGRVLYGPVNKFAGQRFAARTPGDPPGQLTLNEAVLVEGEDAQTNTLRWQDYTQTAIDPEDDCTIWYVGDYVKTGAASYSTRIGAFQLPGCAS